MLEYSKSELAGTKSLQERCEKACNYTIHGKLLSLENIFFSPLHQAFTFEKP